MFNEMTFDDGRGEFSDVIRARAPRGLRDHINRVARQRGISGSEFIRQAIIAHLGRLAAHDEAANDNLPASEIRMSA